MKKTLLLVTSVVVLLYSCGNNNDSTTEQTTAAKVIDTVPQKEFEMYEMSEMALLMEQMYVDNERLKQRIVDGDTIGNFPNHFLKIHESVMTDETDNDAFFKDQAATFLKAQELIYKDSVNAKAHFNDAISACVRCHEQKCGGPIPRIKKLYIK
ncbi:hypothetical protein [Flavobacterium litorale]|uniref:Cytochrome c n=1 Tax=Flavobacterium litorale TaxID=2856519 RepID=A0ABX8VBW9_9FLAO|nr:hypothetical protein [Flavobacterium litorale]QYJ68126.1 hypothetical protein K1I41_11440 [Flavobacterium litorale]